MESRNIWILAITLCLAAFAACGGAPENAEAPAEESASEQPAETFTVDPATAATVTGRVTFSGEPPALRPINMGADEDCKHDHEGAVMPETVVIDADGGLQYAFVWVKSGLEGKAFEIPSNPVVLDQKGCIYKPHVIGLQANQTLRVTNSDTTLHNVHPLPRVNPEWNKSQAAGAGALIEKFPKPELMIPVKCNIHPWMRSYINVVEHPFFAVTAADGSFTIKGLPPGEYTFQAVHERFGDTEVQVTVGEGETKEIDFAFQG